MAISPTTQNFLYDPGRNLFLTGGLNWTNPTALFTGGIKCVLVTASYTSAGANTDQFLSTISGISGAIPTGGKSSAMTSLTASAGIAGCANFNFPSVTWVSSMLALVFYAEGASDAASPLICYIGNATGLPTSNTGTTTQISVNIDAVNKLFKL